jgi:voltage-gated potassium channel
VVEAPKAAITDSDETRYGRPLEGARLRVYAIIFESDTPPGRLFDVLLVVAILVSVIVVMLDSVDSIRIGREQLFDGLEWAFTALFTIEYAARLWCVRKPLRYATSGFGIIDILAILPTYLSFFFPALHLLIDVRVLRLLRIFRILKLGEYVTEFSQLGDALRASRRKIFVFLSFVVMAVIVMGTLMYVVEGPGNGFTSVPASVYWAITTMTTVGFGDITPKTDLGRLIASLMMLLGWGTLAVPTGIVTAEITARRLHPAPPTTTRTCQACLSEGHAAVAKYCSDCGAPMEALQQAEP